MAYRVDEEVVLASGARTTTQTLGPYWSPDDLGDVDFLEVILDLTAFTTAASLTLSIEDEVAGNFRQLVASTALTANGVKRLRVGPTFPNVANESLAALVARRFRVIVTHGNGNSHTYSVTLRIGRSV